MKTRQEAEKYLEKYIPKTVKQNFPANHGLKRAAFLLNLLNNPQNTYPTIHIAGTSGKGTTAYLTSKILSQHQKKVGLHLSPHLDDIRERMLINDEMISDQKFLTYLNDVLKAVDKCTHEFDQPSYFEVLTALAFYVFSKEKVDIAVVETGMGGTYDATNTITRHDKIATITRIGHDHTNILGKTLKQIATQKAGIIQVKNAVITLDDNKVKDVFKKRSEEMNANLFLIQKSSLKNLRVSRSGTKFDFTLDTHKLKSLNLPLLGRHQVENATLALASAYKFLGTLKPELVNKSFQNINFKGRIDRVEKNQKTIIIDGAHNKQKMRALTSTLKEIYPNQKFTTILAIKKGKSVDEMLNLLKPFTETLITTTFFKDTHDLIHIANDENTLAQKAKKLGYDHVETKTTPEEALSTAFQLNNNYILVTGSLYYLQDIYQALKP